ncbi:unnamed protein product [Acanthoscelides obtectus]|uniref:Uncharacterized protein n=1 Tax=Acanthoscelides obtectus TaxID=200917 RepID=A0A9P0JVW9_ACAOB|nr:unnamed protein product [Acanthoscelides obtectus]CAK1647020.1 hypothetical protein AOBTE_LOCUS15005 [Acanthoscelides obtectus]
MKQRSPKRQKERSRETASNGKHDTYDVLSELSHTSSESDPFAEVEIYNPEDPDYHQTCEVKSCKGDKVPRQKVIGKKVREDKRRTAKTLRNQSETYISPVTKKIVKEKALKGICNIEMCKKRKRMCYLFSSPLRTMIFSQFYSLGDLQQQREYIARFVLSENPKHRTTNSNDPRRTQTHYFFLPLEGIRQLVCKKMFLGTLGISEKVCRTAIKKLNRTTSVLEKENRGGRRELQSSRDILIRKSIIEHINRFPRVESHYYRKSSTKQYLHEDLSLSTMYHMYKLKDQQTKGSFSLYRFMNLSFHKPKKDQCGLCKC